MRLRITIIADFDIIEIFTANPGRYGSGSKLGVRGGAGNPGTDGTNGENGFGSSGGNAGFGGVQGGGGIEDANAYSGGISGGRNADESGAPGQGGNREAKGSPLDGSYYSTTAGNPGTADDGDTGVPGTTGSGGNNNATGTGITAGGGGGGAGGGGGGGGGAGGQGGSGAGGGGAGFSEILTRVFETADGGDGGGGGGGGAGGIGGTGADGGPGGGGGGAFELVAGGRLELGTGVQFQAKGGDGAFGSPGIGGVGGNSANGGLGGGTGRSAQDLPSGVKGVDGDQAGEAGDGGKGSTGGAGASGASGGIYGGDGGDGGNGQDGGPGGSGGQGGAGAGGAGGSIKLFASVLDVASDTTIDVSGGLDANGNSSGAGGRVIIGGNTDLVFDTSGSLTAVGGQPDPLKQTGDGTESAEYFTVTQSNPFVFDANANNVNTPQLPGLIGGAEQFGILPGIDATKLGAGFNLASAMDFDLSVANGVFNNAPTDALAAIYRVDLGAEQAFRVDLDGDGDTSDEDFTGYDMLLFVNLTDVNLPAPRLGVHIGASTVTTTIPLQYQGVNENAPVELTALNARTIWATLIPEGDIKVVASIGGTVADGSTQLTAGYIKNVDNSLEANSVEFITAGRPNLDEFGAEGVESRFDSISEVANSVDGDELYVISSDRDALVVVNSADFSVKQVLEGFRDETLGMSLTGLKQVHANPDGKFVYVLGVNGDLGIFARDQITGVLTFQQIQSFDDSPTNFTVTSQEVVEFEFAQTYDVNFNDPTQGFFRAGGDLAFVVLNEAGGWRGDEWVVRAYQRDAVTGTFTQLLSADIGDKPTEIARPGTIKATALFNAEINQLVVADSFNKSAAIGRPTIFDQQCADALRQSIR